MHIISPTGIVLNYPLAHHAGPIEGGTRLYVDSTKTEWVADVPAGWVVASSAPETTTRDRITNLELEASLHVRGEHPRRRWISLFGIPIIYIH